MKVFIDEFDPRDVSLITELSTFINDVHKCVFLICGANRLIESVINVLLLMSGDHYVAVIDSCIDKINISSVCAFLWWCLFDINHAVAFHNKTF